jgi:hypothetical protein
MIKRSNPLVPVAVGPDSVLTVAELVDAIAEALHPGDGLAQTMAREEVTRSWRKRIEKLAASGELRVLDPLTRNPHPFPVGRAIDGALLLGADVVGLLAAGGLGVEPAVADAAGVCASPGNTPRDRPVARQRWQEDRILATLLALGHEPQSLERASQGKRGDPKARCRERLRSEDGAALWTDSKFSKAWARCRASGSVSDAA